MNAFTAAVSWGGGGSNFNTEIYMYKNDAMNCCSDE